MAERMAVDHGLIVTTDILSRTSGNSSREIFGKDVRGTASSQRQPLLGGRPPSH